MATFERHRKYEIVGGPTREMLSDSSRLRDKLDPVQFVIKNEEGKKFVLIVRVCGFGYDPKKVKACHSWILSLWGDQGVFYAKYNSNTREGVLRVEPEI